MNLTEYGLRAAEETHYAAQAAAHLLDRNAAADEPTAEQWRGVIPPFTDEPIDLDADDRIPYLPVYGDAAVLRADLDDARHELRVTRTELDGAKRAHAETMRRYVETVEQNVRLGAQLASAETRAKHAEHRIADWERAAAEHGSDCADTVRRLTEQLDQVRADRDEVHARIRNGLVDLAGVLGLDVTEAGR